MAIATKKKATFEEAWGAIEALAEAQQRTEKAQQRIAEEARQRIAEEARQRTEEARQQTEKALRESWEKTQVSLSQLSNSLKKTNDVFSSSWGKFVESLVEGKLVGLLKNRGISVDKTMTRVRSSNKEEKSDYEFDILAVNGEEVVIVEVKTTLKTKDTKYFLKKLELFKKIFPEYSKKRIYGAVAYLKDDAYAATYSENQGLFVIRATGDSASITNKEGFKPKTF